MVDSVRGSGFSVPLGRATRAHEEELQEAELQPAQAPAPAAKATEGAPWAGKSAPAARRQGAAPALAGPEAALLSALPAEHAKALAQVVEGAQGPKLQSQARSLLAAAKSLPSDVASEVLRGFDAKKPAESLSKLMGTVGLKLRQPVSAPAQPAPQENLAPMGKVPNRLEAMLAGKEGDLMKEVAQPLQAALAKAPAGDRAKLTRALDFENASVGEVSRLLESPAYTKLSAADQTKVAALASRGVLPELNKVIGTLNVKDTQGVTMLDRLSQLADGPMAPGVDRGGLLRAAMTGAANPQTIQQHLRNTCTVTSATQILARQNPAEYVRLLAGVASPEGAVKMANGDVLQRVPGTERDDRSLRNPAERLLQSALMDYGNGKFAYDNERDVSVSGPDVRAGGLFLPEAAKVLGALTGTTLDASVWVPEQSITQLGKPPTVPEVLQSTVEAKRFTTSRDELFDSVQKPAGAQVVGVVWNDFGHAVVLERVENGRAYFSNPGGSDRPAGSEYGPDEPPPRRIENEDGLMSMAIADFRQNLIAVVSRSATAPAKR